MIRYRPGMPGSTRRRAHPCAHGLAWLWLVSCTAAGEPQAEPSEGASAPAVVDTPAEPATPVEQAPTWDRGALRVWTGPQGTRVQLLADGQQWSTLVDVETPDSSIVPTGYGEDARLRMIIGGQLWTFDEQLGHDRGPIPNVYDEYERRYTLALSGDRDGRTWLIGGFSPKLLVLDGHEWTPVSRSFGGPVWGLASGGGDLWIGAGSSVWRRHDDSWTVARDGLTNGHALAASPTGGVVALTDTTLAWVHPESDQLASTHAHGLPDPQQLALNAAGEAAIADSEGRVVLVLEHEGVDELGKLSWLPLVTMSQLALDTRRRAWLGQHIGPMCVLLETGEHCVRPSLDDRLHGLVVLGDGPSDETILGLRESLIASAVRRAAAEPDPSPSESAGEFSWQLATRADRNEALARAVALERGLGKEGINADVFVVQRREYHVVMAGSFTTRTEADLHFARAKAILDEGGFIRDMNEFCPQRREIGEVWSCNVD